MRGGGRCVLLVYAAAFMATFQASPCQHWAFNSTAGDRNDNRGIVLSNAGVVVVVFRGTRLQVHAMLDVAEVVLINRNDLWTDSRCRWRAGRADRPMPGSTALCRHQRTLGAIVRKAIRAETVADRAQPRGRWPRSLLGTWDRHPCRVVHLRQPRVSSAFTAELPRIALPVRPPGRLVPTVAGFIGYVHGGTLRTVPGVRRARLWNDFTSGAGEFAAALKAMASELRVSCGTCRSHPGLADHAPDLLCDAVVECLPGVCAVASGAE
jgi:hypothetical protein